MTTTTQSTCLEDQLWDLVSTEELRASQPITFDLHTFLASEEKDYDKLSFTYMPLSDVLAILKDKYPSPEYFSNQLSKVPTPLLSYNTIFDICRCLLLEQDLEGNELTKSNTNNDNDKTTTAEFINLNEIYLTNTKDTLPKIQQFITSPEEKLRLENSTLEQCFLFTERQILEISNLLDVPELLVINAALSQVFLELTILRDVSTANKLNDFVNQKNYENFALKAWKYSTQLAENFILTEVTPGYSYHYVDDTLQSRPKTYHATLRNLLLSGALEAYLNKVLANIPVSLRDGLIKLLSYKIRMSGIIVKALQEYASLIKENTHKMDRAMHNIHLNMFINTIIYLTYFNVEEDAKKLLARENTDTEILNIVIQEAIHLCVVGSVELSTNAQLSNIINKEHFQEMEFFSNKIQKFYTCTPHRAHQYAKRAKLFNKYITYGTKRIRYNDNPYLHKSDKAECLDFPHHLVLQNIELRSYLYKSLAQDPDGELLDQERKIQASEILNTLLSSEKNNLLVKDPKFQAVSNIVYLNTLLCISNEILKIYEVSSDKVRIRVSKAIQQQYNNTMLPKHILLLTNAEGSGYKLPLLVIQDENTLIHLLVPQTDEMIKALLMLYQEEPNPKLLSGGSFSKDFRKITSSDTKSQTLLSSLLYVNPLISKLSTRDSYGDPIRLNASVGDLRDIAPQEDKDLRELTDLLRSSMVIQKLTAGSSSTEPTLSTDSDGDVRIRLNTLRIFHFKTTHLGDYFGTPSTGNVDELDPNYYFTDYIVQGAPGVSD